MSLMSLEDQEALVEHVTLLTAKVEFLEAELRLARGERRANVGVPVAPPGYRGPVGNSGQPIMTREQAHARHDEEASTQDEDRRKAGMISLAELRAVIRRERSQS